MDGDARERGGQETINVATPSRLLTDDVRDELEWDPRIDPANIEVSEEDGAVTGAARYGMATSGRPTPC